MTRYTSYTAAGALMILLVLACSDSGTRPKDLHLTFSQSECHLDASQASRVVPAGHQVPPPSSITYQSACLDRGESLSVAGGLVSGAVRFAAGHDTLFVYHDSAFYNCCSRLSIQPLRHDSVIDFTESDTASALCDCLCHFNLGSFLAGLSRGTYTGRLWNANHDSLLGETTLQIPGANGIWTESRCDTLFVYHDGRSANCCSKFVFEFGQQANVLTFTERDTLTVPCRCIDCSFDLTARLHGLNAGQYVVRVRDGVAGSLLDTSVVQIAPCIAR